MAAPDPTKPGCAILIVPLKHVAALIKCAVKTPTAAKRPYVSTVPAPHGIIVVGLIRTAAHRWCRGQSRSAWHTYSGGGTHMCNTGQDQLPSAAGCGVLLSGDSFMIRGVKFLFDQRGKKTAVMIDLRQGRGLWEDILDVATARLREREPSENWSTVRGRLEKAGRLKKGRRGA